MLAVNYSELRNNLKDYCDKTIDNLETILVTRKNDRNVVMISLEEYNNLLENSYIMSDSDYYKDLIQRAKEVEEDKVIQKDLIKE
ncbi:type II toxin-antitoxin system Phd/YefM family antitoxin [Anaerococcus sp. Marseille-P3625]|uniref:type II toxin-antitoxin system Phd/YefM family antitoxin n=1 Tax=Anaerococcus sp. Marseille-P3625 TaxID=1977277 RepID=UPI000C08BE4B|nr:type II toxin-antitoxin system prevent-host-death family antitoxin [Anaerococcus sp. Marseille-P3625]